MVADSLRNAIRSVRILAGYNRQIRDDGLRVECQLRQRALVLRHQFQQLFRRCFIHFSILARSSDRRPIVRFLSLSAIASLPPLLASPLSTTNSLVER